jgi:hypothetical protein
VSVAFRERLFFLVAARPRWDLDDRKPLQTEQVFIWLTELELSRNFFREPFHFREQNFFVFLHRFHSLATNPSGLGERHNKAAGK